MIAAAPSSFSCFSASPPCSSLKSRRCKVHIFIKNDKINYGYVYNPSERPHLSLLAVSKLIHSRRVDAVDPVKIHISQMIRLMNWPKQTVFRTPLGSPSLIQEYEENDVISKAGESVHRWHFDDEREQVIDDGSQELVRHLAPGKVGDGLELVVDVELGNHHDEPKGVNKTH